MIDDNEISNHFCWYIADKIWYAKRAGKKEVIVAKVCDKNFHLLLEEYIRNQSYSVNSLENVLTIRW